MTPVNPDPQAAGQPATPPAAVPRTSAERVRWTTQPVRQVHRWTEALVSFRVGRDAAFRFAPGQYARLGLAGADGKPVWRPFSMVSAPDEPELEFVATLVPDGEFSALLRAVRPGDPMLVDQTSFGFLTVDRVAAGRDLWMLASGTGVGPFVSMLRDAAVWGAFESLVLVHSVRRQADLCYRDEIEARVRAAAAAPTAPARLHYVPVVTREPAAGLLAERIPKLIEGGQLQQATGLELAVQPSRILVCGNPDMSAELRALLTARGFVTPRRGLSGQMAFENYW